MEHVPLFICRNGQGRSVAASGEFEGSRFLPGGWGTLFDDIKDLTPEEQIYRLHEAFQDSEPVFIFDPYEASDPEIKNRFALFKRLLDTAHISYEIKTSSALMQEIVNAQLRQRGM